MNRVKTVFISMLLSSASLHAGVITLSDLSNFTPGHSLITFETETALPVFPIGSGVASYTISDAGHSATFQIPKVSGAHADQDLMVTTYSSSANGTPLAPAGGTDGLRPFGPNGPGNEKYLRPALPIPGDTGEGWSPLEITFDSVINRFAAAVVIGFDNTGTPATNGGDLRVKLFSGAVQVGAYNFTEVAPDETFDDLDWHFRGLESDVAFDRIRMDFETIGFFAIDNFRFQRDASLDVPDTSMTLALFGLALLGLIRFARP